MADYGSFEYGGIRFTRTVPQEEIQSYAAGLSDEKRGDIEQIVISLEAAGLLTVEQAAAEPTTAPTTASTASPAVTDLPDFAAGGGAPQSPSYSEAPAAGTVPWGAALVQDQPDPMSATALQYHAIEALSPTLGEATARAASPAMSMVNSSVTSSSLGNSSMYYGQDPSEPQPGSISMGLKVNPGYLRKD